MAAHNAPALVPVPEPHTYSHFDAGQARALQAALRHLNGLSDAAYTIECDGEYRAALAHAAHVMLHAHQLDACAQPGPEPDARVYGELDAKLAPLLAAGGGLRTMLELVRGRMLPAEFSSSVRDLHSSGADAPSGINSSVVYARLYGMPVVARFAHRVVRESKLAAQHAGGRIAYALAHAGVTPHMADLYIDARIEDLVGSLSLIIESDLGDVLSTSALDVDNAAGKTGADLAELVQRASSIVNVRMLALGQAVAALHALHAAGLVHRDCHDDNIVLKYDENDVLQFVYLVGDIIGPRLTSTSAVAGLGSARMEALKAAIGMGAGVIAHRAPLRASIIDWDSALPHVHDNQVRAITPYLYLWLHAADLLVDAKTDAWVRGLDYARIPVGSADATAQFAQAYRELCAAFGVTPESNNDLIAAHANGAARLAVATISVRYKARDGDMYLHPVAVDETGKGWLGPNDRDLIDETLNRDPSAVVKHALAARGSACPYASGALADLIQVCLLAIRKAALVAKAVDHYGSSRDSALAAALGTFLLPRMTRLVLLRDSMTMQDYREYINALYERDTPMVPRVAEALMRHCAGVQPLAHTQLDEALELYIGDMRTMQPYVVLHEMPVPLAARAGVASSPAPVPLLDAEALACILQRDEAKARSHAAREADAGRAPRRARDFSINVPPAKLVARSTPCDA